MPKAFGAICAFLLVVSAGCRETSLANSTSQPTYVLLTYLVGGPASYDGRFVRVAGYCRIEFEGNGLYVDAEAMRSTYGGAKSMWLDVGWPPSERVRSLNGKFVVVDATVDAHSQGHEGAYRGALRVTRIEETTVAREREAMLRVIAHPR